MDQSELLPLSCLLAVAQFFLMASSLGQQSQVGPIWLKSGQDMWAPPVFAHIGSGAQGPAA